MSASNVNIPSVEAAAAQAAAEGGAKQVLSLEPQPVTVGQAEGGGLTAQQPSAPSLPQPSAPAA